MGLNLLVFRIWGGCGSEIEVTNNNNIATYMHNILHLYI